MTQPITDPVKIAELAAQFEASEVQVQVNTKPPLSNEVKLPGGFIDTNGFLIKTAQVRELTGADEEVLAALQSTTRALNTILQRGLVRLGDAAPTAQDLDNLLAGDRDAILLGIRRVTFGETVTFNAVCSSCATPQEPEIHLLTDVPVKELDDPKSESTFAVNIKGKEFILALPNGVTNKRLMELENASMAELVTAILAGCIMAIDDEPSMGVITARSLGIADREKLVAEIYDRAPGPRLGEVSKACEACGTEILLPLSLADLFRL